MSATPATLPPRLQGSRIKDPKSQLSLIEFTTAFQLPNSSPWKICPVARRHAVTDILDGFYDRNASSVPVDGGLKCFGIRRSLGIAYGYEIYNQLWTSRRASAPNVSWA